MPPRPGKALSMTPRFSARVYEAARAGPPDLSKSACVLASATATLSAVGAPPLCDPPSRACAASAARRSTSESISADMAESSPASVWMAQCRTTVRCEESESDVYGYATGRSEPTFL